MKLPLRHLTLLPAAFLQSAALADPVWGNDYDRALVQARAERKTVLLNFSGSDWCGGSIRLRQEVFSTPEFEKYARDYLVLVELDFPQTKSQNGLLKARNAELQRALGVRFFPTVVLLNPQGKKLGQLGYLPGGAANFLSKISELRLRPAMP